MGWFNIIFGFGKGLFQAYKVWFLVVPLVAVLGGGYLYYRQAENNKQKLAVAELQKEQAEKALRINGETLSLCLATNTNNAIEAAIQRGRVRVAEQRIARLAAQADTTVEDIKREAIKYRTDLSCDAITPDFRRWVRDN